MEKRVGLEVRGGGGEGERGGESYTEERGGGLHGEGWAGQGVRI